MLNHGTGFSLVELMVGMAVGLVVMGGSIMLFSSISASTTVMMTSNLMQQELRDVGLVMTRDIRRAGFSGVVPGKDFNGDGLPNVGQTDFAAVVDAVRDDILFNPYLSSSADIKVYDSIGTNDCILFTYNIDADLPPVGTASAVESDEWFGYRRQVVEGRGVLQMKTAGASPISCSAGTWATISSDELNVTALTFGMTTREIEISNLSGGTVAVCEANDACQCIRMVDVELKVSLDREASVSSHMGDSIRVINDKVVKVRSGNAHCHD